MSAQSRYLATNLRHLGSFQRLIGLNQGIRRSLVTLSIAVDKPALRTTNIIPKRFSGRDNIGDGPGIGSNIRDSICPNCKQESLEFQDGPLGGRMKCSNCEQLYVVDVKASTGEHPNAVKAKILTPKQIHEYIRKTVTGQAVALKKMATAIHEHLIRVHHNLKDKVPTGSSARAKSPIDLAYYNTHDILRSDRHVLEVNYPQAPKPMTRSREESPLHENPEKEIKLKKNNCILYGPTGTGKTMTVETLAKISDLPYTSVDCTGLTTAGYVGNDVEQCLQKLYHAADGDIDKAERGIVFLDEVDKLRKTRSLGVYRDVGGEAVQQSLLKLVEGCVVDVPKKSGPRNTQQDTVPMDTSNILFIAGGAFTGIEKVVAKRLRDKSRLGFDSMESPAGDKNEANEIGWTTKNDAEFDAKKAEQEKDELLLQVTAADLIEYGLIPELVGRFSTLVPFTHLPIEMMVEILTNPKNGKLAQETIFFNYHGARLVFTEEAVKAMAALAKTENTGARRLDGIVQEVLSEAKYTVPGSDIIEVFITEEVVTKRTDPIYKRVEPIYAMN